MLALVQVLEPGKVLALALVSARVTGLERVLV